ncbi:MAG: cytochrome P450 [Cyanobacteria bacterium P01_G01_bin.54]
MCTQVALATKVQAFLNDPARRQDPYPLFAQLLAEAPVLQIAPGVWIVVGYQDVKGLLHDQRLSVDFKKSLTNCSNTQSTSINSYLAQMMSMRDPPDHDRLARLVRRGFTPRAVDRVQSAIDAIVDRMLTPWLSEGRVDLISHLGKELPVNVTCAMLGVPESDWAQLQQWTQLLTSQLNRFGQTQSELYAAETAIEDFAAYIRALCNRRLRSPLQKDMLTEIVKATDQGEQLSELEMVSLCMLIFMGGRDTVTNMIGNSVLTLLQHPDQLELLQSDVSLIPGALEECLRFESPIHTSARIALADIQIGEQTLKKGSTVLLMLAAANRDPRQFPNPDQFDIRRSDNAHLAFGYGIHFCTGHAFARTEGRTVLSWLIRNCPGFKLGAAPETLTWMSTFPLRGLANLPIRFEPVYKNTPDSF